MTCWVCIDPPAALAFADVEQRGAELQHLFVGLIEILYPQVEVELLWASGVRPTRREMVSHALEGQHEPRFGVEGRPAVVERPPRVRLVYHATEKGQIEPGKLKDVGTVQHHTLEAGDHESQRRPSGPRTLSRRDHDGGNLSTPVSIQTVAILDARSAAGPPAGARCGGSPRYSISGESRALYGYGSRLRRTVLLGPVTDVSY